MNKFEEQFSMKCVNSFVEFIIIITQIVIKFSMILLAENFLSKLLKSFRVLWEVHLIITKNSLEP